MNSFLIRITKTEELDENELFEFFRGFQVIGCCEHPHDNPHFHFWLLSEKKHDTIQRKLKAIKGVASTKYTVKSADGRLDYLCKGPKAVSKLKAKDYPGVKVFPEIVVNTMSTLSDIEEAHEQWWKEASTWENQKANNQKIIKGNKEKINWFDFLMRHCEVKGINYLSSGWDIAAAIIDCYREHIKCEPNDFQIKCYAKSIQRQLVFQQRPDLYQNYLHNRAKAVIGSEWTSV